VCGIAGIVRESGLIEQDHAALGRMNSVLRHRGPDAGGSWTGGPIGLTHRRLSIIDLSPDSNQPLADNDQHVWISFNGEIYNFAELRRELQERGYAFRTQGDSEVIVNAYRAWGIDAISRLRGMFAFALWDQERQRLLLVRDRLGKKPLYYHASPGRLVFGSEIKAILEHPEVSREVNPSALDYFLTFAYVPSPVTMFAGISRVPPAHVLVCEKGERLLRRYWEPTGPDQNELPSEAEAADRVLELLRESVRLRLVGDVPIGAFLSGGLDSSLVVALMAEQTGKVQTYSVGFTEDEFDELPYAREVAQRFATDHHEIRLTADVAKVLPTLVWHYDQPFGDSSMIPTYYVARAASEHLKVILSGDGGDELFAGYRKYADLARLQSYDRLPGWFVRGVRGFLPDSWHGRTSGWGRLVDSANIRLMHSDERNYHSMAYFTRAEKRTLYGPVMQWALRRDRSRDLYFDVVRSLRAPLGLNRVLLTDARTYLPDDLLVKMDVASMACSLEVRAPMLDHRLFEYCASLPPSFKVGRLGTKHLLKRIGLRFLPPEIVRRPKQGFAIPVDQWLRGALAAFTREVLLEVPTGARNYFAQAEVGRLVETHRSGRRNVGSRLWLLINFYLWYRTFLERDLG
jgi:asparagine synthase (glutamine-hydrolysing)